MPGQNGRHDSLPGGRGRHRLRVLAVTDKAPAGYAEAASDDLPPRCAGAALALERRGCALVVATRGVWTAPGDAHGAPTGLARRVTVLSDTEAARGARGGRSSCRGNGLDRARRGASAAGSGRPGSGRSARRLRPLSAATALRGRSVAPRRLVRRAWRRSRLNAASGVRAAKDPSPRAGALRVGALHARRLASSAPVPADQRQLGGVCLRRGLRMGASARAPVAPRESALEAAARLARRSALSAIPAPQRPCRRSR
jgi:hypothetical protein